MLDDKGFKRKQYSEIVTDMRDRARAVFGDEVNLNDTSFLGMLINVVAWFIGILWQLAEKVYFSRFVDFAEGNSLDVATRNGGIPRRPAEVSRGTAIFTGTGTVPIGTIISAGDLLFTTTESGAVGAEIPIESNEGGSEYNLPAGVIDNVVTELPNVTEVTNTETTGGRNIETDAELRTRYFASLGGGGASTLDSITSELLRTQSVRGARVVEVKETTTGNDYVIGINCVVLDGSPQDIVDSILAKKAHGLKTYGTQTATATADNGQEVIINFDYAEQIDIYINATITKGVAYTTDGDDQVKKILAQYIGGTDSYLEVYAGLTMNQNVIYSKVISEIFKINGVESVDVELSTDNITFIKQDVIIGETQVAETSADKVVIS